MGFQNTNDVFPIHLPQCGLPDTYRAMALTTFMEVVKANRKSKDDIPSCDVVSEQLKHWFDANLGKNWYVVCGRAINFDLRYNQKQYIIMQQKSVMGDDGTKAKPGPPLVVIAFKVSPSSAAVPMAAPLEATEGHKRRLNIKIEDSTMSQEEQNNTAEFLIDAFHKQKQGDEGGAVEEWKVCLVNTFGGTWHTVAGKDKSLAVAIDPAATSRITINCEHVRFVAWQDAGTVPEGFWRWLPEWYLMDGKYVAALLYIAAAICLLISWTYPVEKCGDSEMCIRVIGSMPMSCVVLFLFGFVCKFIFKIQNKRLGQMFNEIDKKKYP